MSQVLEELVAELSAKGTEATVTAIESTTKAAIQTTRSFMAAAEAINRYGAALASLPRVPASLRTTRAPSASLPSSTFTPPAPPAGSFTGSPGFTTGAPAAPPVVSPVVRAIPEVAAATAGGLASINVHAAAAIKQISAAFNPIMAAALMVRTLVNRFVEHIRGTFEAAIKRAREILNIQSLSGSNTKASATFAFSAAAAGLTDTQAVREIIQTARIPQRPQAVQAASKLGIRVNPQEGAVETFNKVLDALSKMQDGIKKTNIEFAMFGASGTRALQPILRMTAGQREAVNALGAAYTRQGAEAIESFEVSGRLLQETFDQRFVMPIMEKVLPALTALIDRVSLLIDWFSDLNDKSGGILAYVTIFTAIAGAVWLVIGALTALNAKQVITNTLQAIWDALSGNWGALAAAVAVGGVAVGGAIAYNHYTGTKDDEIAKNTKETAEGVKQMNGRLVGGGERGRRAMSGAQADYAIAHALGAAVA